MQRGDDRVKTPIQEASEIVVTPVVIGELLFGFKRGSREDANLCLLREFLASPRVCVVDLDGATAEHYASIQEHLRSKGTPIPTNDLWIAASAAQHGLRILTTDEHFRRVPHVLVSSLERR